MLSAEQAVELCEALEGARVRYWVMGGWGVDALLGRETRSHKDLDILALIDDLPQLRRLFGDNGFALCLVWEESQWTESAGERWPTAFVASDAIGREIDVHLIEILSDGLILQHYDNPWSLPESFATTGTIDTKAVPCVSRAAQLKMHTGYVVPKEQELDLERLQARGDGVADTPPAALVEPDLSGDVSAVRFTIRSRGPGSDKPSR